MLSYSSLLRNSVPHTINDIFVGQTFVNAVAADEEVVEIVFKFECCDFRFTNYYVGISSVPLFFSLNIAEGPRN